MIVCLLGLLPGCATRHPTQVLVKDQPISKGHYSVQNAHSHNDYAQKDFFWEAYNAGFGSMEADVYLVDGQLMVAHNKKDIHTARTLAAMYLAPLARQVRKNKGYPYKNHKDALELLIDLKDPKDSPAYKTAIQLIRSYRALVNSKHIRFTFTGNIPGDHTMATATGNIYFDGVPGRIYSPSALKRIYMLSDNFARYSSWDGTGVISVDDYQQLQNTVKAAHRQGKKIRFWNAPDNLAAWQLMEELGVDFINTDKIQELSGYLNEK